MRSSVEFMRRHRRDRGTTWRGHPIAGVLFEVQHDWLGTMERLAQQGDAVHFRLLHQHVHLLTHPDHIQHVLVTGARYYGKGTPGYRRLRALLGDGLVISEGNFWRRQRRIAQPAFHRRRLEGFAGTMARVAEQTVARWPDGAVVDISREMMRLTLRVVSLTMLSRDVREESDEVGDAIEVALEHIMRRSTGPVALPEWVPSPRNRRFRRAVGTLDRVVGGIIAARRRRGVREDDLLGMLMDARDEDNGAQMTDVQLRDEVMTVFLAGHETTAMALTWTFHLLAQHPDIERRVRQELEDVLGGDTPKLEDLPKLELTDRVLHESLRLYPPVWIFSRSVNQDHEVQGHPVRRGDWVFLSPWITHRHPGLWHAPEVFDPDRFTPERSAERSKYAFFPFAGGQRKCIGDQFALMEARLVLATILQRAALSPVSGRPVVPQPLITLRPFDGLPMRVTRAARATHSTAARDALS